MRSIFCTALLLIFACGGAKQDQPTITRQEVRAAQSAALPTQDPMSPDWKGVSEFVTKLQLQDIAEPKLTEAGVPELRVKALYNGDSISFLLSWADPSPELLSGPGLFSDGVAVQLPTEPGGDVPDPAMGQQSKPVQIFYWKAAWQQEDQVAALRPNMQPDTYPYESGVAPGFSPAKAAHNPSMERPNGTPVQSLLSEGYGSLSPTEEQRAVGKGVWKDGRWYVVITAPMTSKAGSPFTQGRRTFVAFAVWDGAKENVGAKKMRSIWSPLILEEKI